MDRTRLAAALLVVFLIAASRFIHADLVWIEEAYPLAAAAEILRGKVLYRDIWFDKPPLYALIYVLWGANPGWPLRLGGAAYVLLTCCWTWRLFRKVGSESESLTAAVLLALFLTFGIPSAVMALAPDLLTLPLHIAAVLLAMQGRAFASGLAAGVALLFNSKAVFILAACLLWAPKLETLIGFVSPNAPALIVLALTGSLPAYWQQVWSWGMRYSADTFVNSPLREGTIRTLNWAGFHAALAAGTGIWLIRRPSWRTGAWLALSIAAVCAGWRFFPRYYFHLLPVLLFAGVRGMFLLQRKWRIVLLLTILVPVARFGPRYVSLASGDRTWSDLALMNDSKEAAAIVRAAARPGDRLLVWGYRPDIFVFSGLPAATRFLDSQPLTGVLADRHLTGSRPTAPGLGMVNQRELTEGRRPEIIVDGLGGLNPALAASRYPALHLDRYEVAGRTSLSTVYVTKR